MPKVIINKNFEMDKNFKKAVKHGFVETNTNCDVLSKASKRSTRTIYKRLESPETITLEELRIWVNVLNMPIEQIISFIKL